MGKRVTSAREAAELFRLLNRISDGYEPTDPEWAALNEVEEIAFSFRETRKNFSLRGVDKLANLRRLALFGADINNLVSISLPQSLQSLDLSGKNISSLEGISLPQSLQFLGLGDTNISSLEGISLPQSLQALELCYTNISSLEDISLPQSLQSLNLSRTNISSLEDISLPQSLQSLDLSRTNISSLEGISLPQSLQSLNLRGTNISSLEGISRLQSLQSLDLSGTNISSLEGISLPQSLLLLNLSDTNISSLEGISLPQYLLSLHLSGTNISSLEGISLPDSLEFLELSNTPITHLPASLGTQPHLKQLFIQDLFLRSIPADLLKLRLPFCNDSENQYFSGIFLAGTTLSVQPVSLFSQPRELVEAYYRAPKTSIRESKVIFLGDGGVGKSFTIQRLLHGGDAGDYPTEVTPGIDISDYHVQQPDRDFHIHFWDFGGQEIMHAMHRCFLTTRTCYVVVVCNRMRDLTGQARYWLNNINSFAEGSPVILAINLWDDIPTWELDSTRLHREFPNLVQIIPYSAKSGSQASFQPLTEAIVEQAWRLDSCRMEFPSTWAGIRESLLDLAREKRNYIDREAYHQICREHGETNPEICTWLLSWFNDLGVCFSYHQNPEDQTELREYQVLNPAWLTNAVYRIICFGARYAINGIIRTDAILDLLQRPDGGVLPHVTYTAQERDYVLEIMRKFRLSYSISPEVELIPALCKSTMPDQLHPTDWTQHIAYEMVYSYLPDSVIHRLIIHFYQSLNIRENWRRGFRINLDPLNGLSAVVDMGGGDSILNIDVYAKSNTPPWQLLQTLRQEILHINQELNLQAKEYIVMQKNKQTARFPLIPVLKAKTKGITVLPSLEDDELEMYPVDDILGTALGTENIESINRAIRESPQQDPASVMQQTIVQGNYYNFSNCPIRNSSADAERILQTVLEHQDTANDRLVTTLISIFESQNAGKEVQQLAQEMKKDAKDKKQNPLARLAGFVKQTADTADNFKKLAAILTPSVTYLVEHAPEILQFLGLS